MNLRVVSSLALLGLTVVAIISDKSKERKRKLEEAEEIQKLDDELHKNNMAMMADIKKNVNAVIAHKILEENGLI